MKQPYKPSEPKPPKVPVEPLATSEEFVDLRLIDKMTLGDIKSLNDVELPKGITIDDIKIKCDDMYIETYYSQDDAGYYCSSLVIGYVCKIHNKNYDKQLIAYKKALAQYESNVEKYNRDKAEYEIKIAKYNEDLKEYEQQIAKKKIEKLEKEISKLKKSL